MTRIIVMSLATLLLTRSAHADIGDFESAMVDHFIDNYERNLIEDSVVRGRTGKSSPEKATTVVPRRAARMPKVLAAKAPAEQRAALARQLGELLTTYDEIAKKLHMPERDISAELAVLMCTAYSAYRGSDISDAALPATQKQMHDVLLETPGFTKLSTEQKQDLYEQLAIVSTQLALSFMAAKSDPSKQAELRELARTTLAGFGDPDKVEIGDHGVTLTR